MAQKGMVRMGVTNANKSINVDKIECGGTFTVTLSLTAEPDLMSNPTDIVLILDRSGSMTGTPMMHLKAGAKEFIDIVMKRTGGRMGRLANGNRIGIVSFAGTECLGDNLGHLKDCLFPWECPNPWESLCICPHLKE